LTIPEAFLLRADEVFESRFPKFRHLSSSRSGWKRERSTVRAAPSNAQAAMAVIMRSVSPGSGRTADFSQLGRAFMRAMNAPMRGKRW
jgi:hypothetical protein